MTTLERAPEPTTDAADFDAILRVRDLTIEFPLKGGILRAADGVSFTIRPGEVFGIVGESGSGKSVSALAIMRILDKNARVVKGSISFQGEDLLAKSDAEMQRIRGRHIGMIFQEPMTSLNPAFSVGEQVAEVYRTHLRLSSGEARKRTVQMFDRVQIPSANLMFDKYPYEFSGGMRQRVMIAMALACEPALVIADEPTTALDVTIQAQILSLLEELQREMGMALMFISHNLEVVAQICHRVAVMYASRLMEVGDTEALFKAPAHPYTYGLLRSIPRRGQPLMSIPGTITNLLNPPAGCYFHPRCFQAAEVCTRVTPPLDVVANDPVQGKHPRRAACHFPLTAPQGHLPTEPQVVGGAK